VIEASNLGVSKLSVNQLFIVGMKYLFQNGEVQVKEQEESTIVVKSALELQF
jgi:hypothetical protein